MTTPSFTIDRRFAATVSNGGYFAAWLQSTQHWWPLTGTPRSMYLLHWTATGSASEMTVKILVSPFKPGSLRAKPLLSDQARLISEQGRVERINHPFRLVLFADQIETEQTACVFSPAQMPTRRSMRSLVRGGSVGK